LEEDKSTPNSMHLLKAKNSSKKPNIERATYAALISHQHRRNTLQ